MGDHETPAPGEGIDLQVTSSQIDLGVIQGFTSYVTNVTGTLQANVRVTGTGDDPHFNGAIDVRGGSFAVPELGTAYTGLDTRIDLKTDAVDDQRDANRRRAQAGDDDRRHDGGARAGGRRGGRHGQSEDFEVIDNELADLKLDTDIRVTGELRAPRVEGFVEVETGSVDVARVLEEVTADPYSTEAARSSTAAIAAAAALAPAPATLQALFLDAVELESASACRAIWCCAATTSGRRMPPIDVGDLNVTVGGAIQVRKAPGERFRAIGEVNTIRGSYTFQGRRFEILRDGRIRFDGTEEIDPLVDIQARRVISGVETFVRVQGSMREPELSFSSKPPLDQADILSLIVFNVPINELGEGQQVSLAERAGALAGGYLVSGLTRSIADALGWTSSRFQTQGEAASGRP